MPRRFPALTALPGPTGPAERSAAAGELDAPTLARAQAGDEEACHALVVRYQDRVWWVLGRIVGQRAQRTMISTADLAQETFLRVFRQLARFSADGPARLSTWILTIATRVAIDELRHRCPEVLSDGAVATEISAARTDDKVHSDDALAAVERALAGLPADWRAVLLLRLEHELDYEEIARALDVAVGTVRSRLARARAALWTTLAELREAP